MAVGKEGPIQRAAAQYQREARAVPTQPAHPSDMRPVGVQLEQLDLALGHLGSVIEELTARLSPLTPPVATGVDAPVAESIGDSPLAQTIQRYALRVTSAARHLNTLSSIIEI